MENRDGLIVDTVPTRASRIFEREAALDMVGRRSRRQITLGADSAYYVSGFVPDQRACKVTPQIAIDGHFTETVKLCKAGIYKRTTRHLDYAVSQRRHSLHSGHNTQTDSRRMTLSETLISSPNIIGSPAKAKRHAANALVKRPNSRAACQQPAK